MVRGCQQVGAGCLFLDAVAFSCICRRNAASADLDAFGQQFVRQGTCDRGHWKRKVMYIDFNQSQESCGPS